MMLLPILLCYLGGYPIDIDSVVFMAFAPHLSLYVVVLVFIMAFIGFSFVRSSCLSVFVGGVCVVGGIGCRGGLWVMGGLCGNSIWACAKASLLSLGAVLNFCLNSLGDSIWCVLGFWIWLRVVMLYVWSLLRYFLT